MTGEKIFLREVGPGDLEFLHRWENDPEVWLFGDCGRNESCGTERFSREQLRQFIENQQYGIEAAGQLRLMICVRAASGLGLSGGASGGVDSDSGLSGGRVVGMIDLFDVAPVDRGGRRGRREQRGRRGRRAEVGILICEPGDRRRGYALEALKLTMDYARNALGMSCLGCTVESDNLPSLALFRAAGFREVAPDALAESADAAIRRVEMGFDLRGL